MIDVQFLAILKKGVDESEAKSKLESLADNISGEIKGRSSRRYIGKTSKETYEIVFCTQLEYEQYTVNASVGRPQQVEEWKEVRPAQLSEELKKYYSSISLNRKAHTC